MPATGRCSRSARREVVTHVERAAVAIDSVPSYRRMIAQRIGIGVDDTLEGLASATTMVVVARDVDVAVDDAAPSRLICTGLARSGS